MILQDWSIGQFVLYTVADGFHVKDVDKLYQICCQVLGKKITIRKTNYKHKIEKIYFMNIHI